ncbi:MAG: hypothetical protein [Olavius algarvensis spirochete endosymbiont]|nr:MAG: hypothetical protein [Olavius algarvensis spirochete endosymbiont]
MLFVIQADFTDKTKVPKLRWILVLRADSMDW